MQQTKPINKNSHLKQFEYILNTKSKNSIKVSDNIISNPHNQLIRNISPFSLKS